MKDLSKIKQIKKEEATGLHEDGVPGRRQVRVPVEDRHARQQRLHEKQVREQGVSSLPGGQGGWSGGDQPPLDGLLGLQGATTWTGPCLGAEGQNTVSKKSTGIKKSDGEK